MGKNIKPQAPVPKTLGQVAYEALHHGDALSRPWGSLMKCSPAEVEDWERAASAVIEALTGAALMRWLPMETAPTSGQEAVLLLIDGGEHPLHDDTPSVSVGSFGVDGGPEDDPTWSWAGWDWHQDCYCRGSGRPVGWMPLPPFTASTQLATPAHDVQASASVPARPDLLEKLTYHQLERDDLTLDEVQSALASGWKTVRGRSERQMLLQLLSLMASQHAISATTNGEER